MTMSSRMNRRALWWAVIAGVALRIAYVLFYPQMGVHADAACYDALGWSLAQGQGYHLPGEAPDVYWAPGYPAFLAAVYAVAGHSLTAARIAQALLGGAQIWLVGRIGTRAFTPRIGVLGAWACALYLPFIGYTGLFLTETLYATLLVLATDGLMTMAERPTAARAIWLGALAGLTSLVRAETVLLPLFTVAGLWLVWRHRSTSLVQWALLYGVAALAVLPWAARNYRVTGEFIPLTVHGGDVLWISTYPAEWLELDTEREPFRSIVAGKTQAQASKALRAAGIRNIIEHPGAYVWMSAKRAPRLWLSGHSNAFDGMLDSIGDYWRRGQRAVAGVKAGMLVANTLLVLAGFAGAVAMMTRTGAAGRLRWIVVAPVVFTTALHIVLFAAPRFHVPIMPFMLIFAAALWWREVYGEESPA